MYMYCSSPEGLLRSWARHLARCAAVSKWGGAIRGASAADRFVEDIILGSGIK